MAKGATPQSSAAAGATHHQTPVARAHNLHKTSKKPDGENRSKAMGTGLVQHPVNKREVISIPNNKIRKGSMVWFFPRPIHGPWPDFGNSTFCRNYKDCHR
jgi:hypothetical protein